MISMTRTDSDNPHFRELVIALDKDLAIRDGDDHAFYAQFNKTANLKHCIVAYTDGLPVGSGALRQYTDGVMEVKRMYVPPAYRGRGIASAVLSELENWAKELGYKKCILETGQNQPEAINMYDKCGYHRIPNYGPYADVYNSVCFEKELDGSDLSNL
jgi:putative acetyltransferase